jgi:hypothetical protein
MTTTTDEVNIPNSATAGTSSSALRIVNPIALQKADMEDSDAVSLAPRVPKLTGRVGLYWNGKQQGDLALEYTRNEMERLYPDVEFRDYMGETGGALRRASDRLLDAIASECSAVIGASADCGSCTSWLIRDLCGVERRGTPAVAWTASQFEGDARWSARIFGVPDLAIARVPECFTSNSPERIRQMIQNGLPDLICCLTENIETPVGRIHGFVRDDLEKSELCFEGADALDAWEAMNARFVRNGWSDGLPLVAPTPRKVAAMVQASGLPPDHVLGYLEPGFGLATVQKVAANAVMAGASPAMMALILAVVDAALDSRAGWRSVSMSTGPQAPLILVSGDVAAELGLNSGTAPIGPGSQNAANIAIGRALRLIMMNVGLSYPGFSDMDTHGTCMKFAYCVAENGEANPWEPYRVTKGFDAASSVIGLNAPFSQTCLHDFTSHDPKTLVEVFASAMATVPATMASTWLTTVRADESQPAAVRGEADNVLLLGPDHASVFSRAGYSLRDVKEALFEACRIPFRKAMLNQAEALFKVAHPELQWMRDYPEMGISAFTSPDRFDIMVVGGAGGWSTWHDGGTYTVLREVGPAGVRSAS